jgi:dephospho-CoA kinase
MTYNFISRDPILFELNQQLRNKTGVAFINSALLIEAKLTPLCNNNVVFVKAPEDFRMENLKSRGYTGEELDGRMNGQMSGKGKEETFMKLIEEEWGQLLYLNNSPNIKDRDLAHLLEQIMNLTGCV